MNVTATRIDDSQVQIGMGVPDFLQGPVMTHLAALNNDCDPADILRYLPNDLDAMDDDELTQVVEEACVLACNIDPTATGVIPFLTVSEVHVEPEDLFDLKRTLRLNHGLQLLPPPAFGPEPLWAA